MPKFYIESLDKHLFWNIKKTIIWREQYVLRNNKLTLIFFYVSRLIQIKRTRDKHDLTLKSIIISLILELGELGILLLLLGFVYEPCQVKVRSFLLLIKEEFWDSSICPPQLFSDSTPHCHISQLQKPALSRF